MFLTRSHPHATAHLNTSFAHFLLFVDEVCRSFPAFPLRSLGRIAHTQPTLRARQFKLIEKKELAPLAELNASILSR